MPDDLLRYLLDPPPNPTGWIWGAASIAALVLAWYVAVLWWTATERAAPGVVTAARGALTRHRALRAIENTRKHHRAADLSTQSAAAELSGHVRRFLRDTTGQRVEYLQLPDVAGGVLAPAAPVLIDLADVRFNRASVIDIETVADAAERLVREWT